MTNAELIERLRKCSSFETCNPETCDLWYEDDCRSILLKYAADAIERLTAEADRKDKTIERMRDLMKHYKAAYRTAYKLYQEARNEKLS